MNGIRAALAFATAGKYMVALISLGTTAVVSRLISPAEFGISVLGMATLAVAGAVRELGSAAYVVQAPELDDNKLRGVFTINLAITICLSLAIIAGAPALARLLNEPAIVSFTQIAIMGFLTGSFVYPLHGLLARDLAFQKISAVNVATAAVNAGTLIVLASLGFSYLSFAWANVASGIAGALILLWLKPHFTMFRPGLKAWRDILSFSVFTGGSALLHRLSEYLSLTVLGYFLSAAGVGLIHRASLVCQFPERTILAGVTDVALPAFSDLARRKENLAASYLGAIERLTVFMWPALGLLAILAHPLVLAYLGPDWTATIPLVQIIAVALLLNFPPGLNYPLIIATGAAKRAFVLAIIQVTITFPIVVFAARISVEAVAWSTFAIVAVAVVTSTIAVRSVVHFSFAGLLLSMRRSFVVTVIALAPPALWAWMAGGASRMSFGEAILAIALSALGWYIGLVVVRHPIHPEIGRLFVALKRRLVR